MCILELSKVLMYEFCYRCNKNKYDNKSKLLFTDTDSLMYDIKTEDDYEDFSSDKEMFDFINYSTKSKYHDDSNKLVVAIEELVGLKRKMCSFLVDNNEQSKRRKQKCCYNDRNINIMNIKMYYSRINVWDIQ